MPARSISCSAWPAATNIFFGVQPRFGQVPPRSLASISATDIPARRTGPVTPTPALPPPRITTSNCSAVIELAPSSGDRHTSSALRTLRYGFALRYLVVMVEMIDWTTLVAILN